MSRSNSVRIALLVVVGVLGSTDSAHGRWLAGVAPAAQVAGTCVADATRLCLLGGRFALTVAWQNPYDGSTGSGRAIPRTDFAGFFSFGDPQNLELMVKMLDFGDTVKLFYGQLTDFDFTLTVVDTTNGAVRTYGPTFGDCGGIDQAAFGSVGLRAKKRVGGSSTSPPGTCVADARTLCLLGNRFSVRASWANPYNGVRGTAIATSLGDLTGLFTYDDPRNVELLVKTLDFGDRLIVLYGALSDFAYDITLTDTVTGRRRRYQNPGGRYCGGLDPDAQGARFLPLGELAGGADRSDAFGVSADGRVVAGGSASTASGDRLEAFRWREGEGMAPLGDLVGGVFESLGSGISPDGGLVLGSATRPEGREAVSWNVAGAMTPLGELPGGAFGSRARAASADNRILVGDSDGPSGSEAVRWADGRIEGLGDLPGGIFGSGAADVSADGEVVVGFGHLEADIHGFRWTAGGGMQLLADLPGGRLQSSAQAISADGRVIVGICATEVGSEACRWVDGGAPERLGTAPLAGAQTTAVDVAEDGAAIVGSYFVDSNDRHVYLWTPARGMLDLASHLAALGATGLEGWRLETASAISVDGLTIVGWGSAPSGARQAWLARLPALP